MRRRILTIALWFLLSILTGGVCAGIWALINWFPELYSE